MDLREYNSSSYRGIDSIRDIARISTLAPVGKCRVFILDEAHRLTGDAQNASLKMLEDSPPNSYFMLCTTDPDKLINAIRTRCTHMPVRALQYDELMKLLNRVVKKEGIVLSEQHADEVVAAANGSARLLLVILEKIACLAEADRSAAILNRVGDETQAIDLCRALVKRVPWKKVAGLLRGLQAEDVESVRWSVLGYCRSVLLSEKGGGPEQQQAFFVIQAFAKPFYDSKESGLAAACYEAVVGE
jgi:DNA polymerase III gamma/tau subunit